MDIARNTRHLINQIFDNYIENRVRSNGLIMICNILDNGTAPCIRDFFSARCDNSNCVPKSLRSAHTNMLMIVHKVNVS